MSKLAVQFQIKMKNSKPFISIKIVYNDKKVKLISSHSRRRIFRFIEATNFQECVVWLSVNYGPGESNKGLYKTKDELVSALKVFLE